MGNNFFHSILTITAPGTGSGWTIHLCPALLSHTCCYLRPWITLGKSFFMSKGLYVYVSVCVWVCVYACISYKITQHKHTLNRLPIYNMRPFNFTQGVSWRVASSNMLWPKTENFISLCKFPQYRLQDFLGGSEADDILKLFS